MPRRKLTAILGKLTRISEGLKAHLENNSTLLFQTLERYDKLLRPNMDANLAHFIVSGSCKFYWKDREYEDMIFRFGLENDVILLAEEFFLGIKNEDVYIQMLERAEILTVTKVQMDEIYKNFPEAHEMTNLIRRKIILDLNRHLRILMEKEGDRYQLFCEGFPELAEKNLSEKDLCNFLRISRSTLSDSKRELTSKKEEDKA